ncbi:MAG: hypothetical protein Q7R87_03235 [Nanoarchaeota archaeon]|nr:hypothetical protein [Nanoarchaeota archaeon]
MKNKNIILILFLGIVFNSVFVIGAADFDVNSFSCTPSEAVINNVFSCTAQIINNGDATGAVSVATLYPDEDDWLEDSNYPKTDGTNVEPGQTTEITFTGLRATKSGSNGFARILLDDVTDTYVADNNIEINIIDVAVSVSNSASSAAMSSDFTSTSEVNAGGNIDVVLTFTVNSGGCSIGNQGSSKTISNMQDGNTQSRTWTVTQGTTGNCAYTISAAATGDSGVATKTDSTSSTVTCTDCPVSSGSSSSGSSGGGSGSSSSSGVGAGSSGGAGGVISRIIGELISEETVVLGVDQAIKFNISGAEHRLNVKNLSNTWVKIAIESEVQEFILNIGEQIDVSLDGDGGSAITIMLKSINFITKKATFVLTPSLVTINSKSGKKAGKDSEKNDSGIPSISELKKKIKNFGIGKFFGIILAIIIVMVVIFIIIRAKNNYSWFGLKHKVKIRHGKDIRIH